MSYSIFRIRFVVKPRRPKGIPKIADQVAFYRIKVAQGTTYELVFKVRYDAGITEDTVQEQDEA